VQKFQLNEEHLEQTELQAIQLNVPSVVNPSPQLDVHVPFLRN